MWILSRAWTEAISADDLALPLLVMLALVLIRAITNAPTYRLADAELKYERASEALREVSHRYLTTLEVKSRLEQRIVEQPTSVVTLYEIARRLETLESAGVYRGLLDAIVKFLGATSCAVYVEDEGQLRLLVGWPAEQAGRPRTLSPEIDLVNAVLQRHLVTTIRDFPPEARRAGLDMTPAMAGPLLGREKQRPGVVVIERIPFLNLTPAHARLFGLILDWASTALQHALQYEEARSRAVDDEQTGICTTWYTARRLQEELQRSRGYGHPLSLVVIQIDDVTSVSPPMLDVLIRALGAVFRQHVRAVDVIGQLDARGQFGLILPMTSLEEAQQRARRINTAVGYFALKPYADRRALSLSFGFAATAFDPTRSVVTEPVGDADAFLERALADVKPLHD